MVMEGLKGTSDRAKLREDGKWDARVAITPMLRDTEVKFFYPLTTTLIELRLNREPMPLAGRNTVFWFLDGD